MAAKKKAAAKKKKFDTLVKDALKTWPTWSDDLWPIPRPAGVWLRAQPVDGSTVGPRLKAAGTDIFKTQPDGLWLFISKEDGFADCIAIEGCSTSQNFADKRSRYSPSTTATVVDVPRAWLKKHPGNRSRPRWEHCHGFTAAPDRDLEFPARFLRVLFFLKNELYTSWRSVGVPAAHEFVASYSSVRSYQAQQMQSFLRRMSPEQHFYKNA